VARQLNLSPSYVSRVARGERQSKKVEAMLERELKKLLNQVVSAGHSGRRSTKAKRAAPKE
jgi:hypothetical protein